MTSHVWKTNMYIWPFLPTQLGDKTQPGTIRITSSAPWNHSNTFSVFARIRWGPFGALLLPNFGGVSRFPVDDRWFCQLPDSRPLFLNQKDIWLGKTCPTSAPNTQSGWNEWPGNSRSSCWRLRGEFGIYGDVKGPCSCWWTKRKQTHRHTLDKSRQEMDSWKQILWTNCFLSRCVLFWEHFQHVFFQVCLEHFAELETDRSK